MSSHREAPEISKDPVADNTDVYAFVSPDAPSTVTLIANYIPLEGPDAGPNFYEFGQDVLYKIHIDNDGDGDADISYEFRFTTEVRNPETFLYNTGPITSLDSPNWNRRQLYSVTRILHGQIANTVNNITSPPCNIGPRSTPNYAALAQHAVHHLDTGEYVFAGQRREGFFVDLGAIFDLGTLRPFENLHLIPTPAAPGVDATKDLNVHTIAVQVPISQLWSDEDGQGSSTKPIIGVWATASRPRARIYGDNTEQSWTTGPWVQVSRLGNPLFNEVIVPMGHKDRWNSLPPSADSQFAQYVAHPELAKLLPILYPNVFPHLAAYTAPRADLEAILLTGIPSGIIKGFTNYTGKTQADMLRLNTAIAPSSNPSPLGLLGGDLAGFPNGRRVFDDVVAIELRAVAGVTIPLVDPSFKPDGAAGLLKDGTSPGPDRYVSHFPYLGVPLSGYNEPAS